MLRNTFCHIPGIGLKSERNLWAKGILSWDDVVGLPVEKLPPSNAHHLRYRVIESIQCLADHDQRYFADRLPLTEAWRLFADFRDSVAYLDIETSGSNGSGATITTISVYDGARVNCYVKDDNLLKFARDIREYRLIVTYNGKSFDVPVIEAFFGIKLKQAHIDLRHILKSLGYTGGLKGCEKKAGIDRGELDGVNGFFAVLLWQDFKTNRNRKALETLLSYNVLDAVNLEALMVLAHNLKVKETPFAETHQLPIPEPVANPHTPHVPTLRRLMSLFGHVLSR